MFGSQVTGKIHHNSDIDIAVFSKEKNLLPDKLRLMGELEDIINSPVDLVVIHQNISLLLLHEIMTKGKPLYMTNSDIFFEKKIYGIKIFEDFQFLKRYQEESLSFKLKRLKDSISKN